VTARRAAFHTKPREYSRTELCDAIYRILGGGNTTEPKLMDTREGVLLGRPKIDGRRCSTATTTSKATPLIVGDWDEFRIADRVGMSIELVPLVFGSALQHRPIPD
jgi:hypothetical protein